jgi:hypothetical protein
MSGRLSNKERKKIVGDAIKAHEACIQASIDACNKKRADNRRHRQELAEAQEQWRLQQLANLRKRMVIIFAEIDGQIVIVAIVDPSLMRSTYSVGMKHHITYGVPEYRKLFMKASYSFKGKRLELKENHKYSYTVSTTDDFNFDIIDTDGTRRLSFETLIHYESLAGKSFSGVQFDQFFYDPFKDSFDAETAKFHAELDRLIEADADYVRKNPQLLEEGYIPYFRLGF